MNASIACASGAFALTGATAGVSAAFLAVCDAGSFALVGHSANIVETVLSRPAEIRCTPVALTQIVASALALSDVSVSISCATTIEPLAIVSTETQPLATLLSVIEGSTS